MNGWMDRWTDARPIMTRQDIFRILPYSFNFLVHAFDMITRSHVGDKTIYYHVNSLRHDIETQRGYRHCRGRNAAPKVVATHLW